MNKFKNLTAKLIKNTLWSSNIIYVVTQEEDNGIGLPKSWGDISRLSMKAIVKKVSKNLVDNEKIVNTDESFIIDALSFVPKIQDKIERGEATYKIVAIFPLGILSDEPTAYEIVARLA